MGTVSQQGEDDATALPLEGLRERKKRQMRKLISDTATAMFLERGFDEVRVTEVAAQCGVSEKTVYNYFPTKESLLLDREEDSAVAIRVLRSGQAHRRGRRSRAPSRCCNASLKTCVSTGTTTPATQRSSNGSST